MRWHCVVITKLLDLNFAASKLGGRWTMDLLLPEREQCWSWKEWTADVLQAFVVNRYLSAVVFKRVWTASSRWYFIMLIALKAFYLFVIFCVYFISFTQFNYEHNCRVKFYDINWNSCEDIIKEKTIQRLWYVSFKLNTIKLS